MEVDLSPGTAQPQAHTMRTPLLAAGRPAAYDRQHMRSKSGEFLREEEELDDGMEEGSWLYEFTTNYRKLKNSRFDLRQSWARFKHTLQLYDADMLKRDFIAGLSEAGLLLPGVRARVHALHEGMRRR